MPENEEIHAYEFQKRPYFFTISCLYFPKKPGRNGNKSPEFRIPGLSTHKKLIFYSSTILKSNYQSACIFTI